MELLSISIAEVEAHIAQATEGDELKSDAPALQIKVVGTDKLTRVEIIRDSEVVQTYEPKKTEFQEKWADPKPANDSMQLYFGLELAR